MKTLRATISILVSAALIILSPGLDCYRAAAQMVSGSGVSGAVSATGVAGAVPVQAGASRLSPAAVGLTPVSGLTRAALVTPGALAAPSIAGAASAAQAQGSAAAARGSAAQAAGSSIVEIISAPAAPVATSRAGVASSRQAGGAASRAAAATRGAQEPTAASERGRSAVGQLVEAARRASRKTPHFEESPSRGDDGGVDVSHLDELGNPRREQSDGPDSVSDEFGGRDGGGGNSELFSLPMQGFRRAMGTGGADVALSKSSRRGSKTPHFEESPSRGSDGGVDVSHLDELGNPRREQSDGPDSVSGDFGGDGGRGNSDLFAFLPTAISIGATTALAAAANIALLPVYLGLIVPSLILHEMGHAKAADMLGDPTPRLAGRLSFRPRDLLRHINPIMTIALPIFTILTGGFIFGGAVPVRVNQANFLRPQADMGKVAVAGPAVNLGLAILGGFGHAAAVALGLTAAGSMLSLFVYFNVMLALFNLLPFSPLDGHHIVRSALRSDFVNRLLPGRAVADSLDRHPFVQMALGLVLLMSVLGGPLVGLTQALTGVFLGGS